MLFTFLYSKRSGTPAASFEDPATKEEKQNRFERLLHAQDACIEPRQTVYLGKRLRVLVDGTSKDTDIHILRAQKADYWYAVQETASVLENSRKFKLKRQRCAACLHAKRQRNKIAFGGYHGRTYAHDEAIL